MGGAVFPSLWLVGLSHPSPWTYRLLGGARSWWKNGSLQEGSCQWVLPRTTAERIFVPTVSHSTRPPQHLHRKPSNSSRQVWPRLLWGHCILPWVLGHTRSCVFPLRMEFLFAPVLCNSCDQTHWSSKPDALRALLPNARPPGCGAWPRTQQFHSCGRTSAL